MYTYIANENQRIKYINSTNKFVMASKLSKFIEYFTRANLQNIKIFY